MNYNFSSFKWVLKIISILILFNSNHVLAQLNFNGKVIGADLSPLSYVAIKNISKLTGTITNDSGYYYFNAEIGNTLEFEKIGYNTQTIIFAGISGCCFKNSVKPKLAPPK